MENKTENIQVRVTPTFKKRLEKVCEYEGLYKSDVVTLAVKKYIDEIEERMIKELP